jgi:hypothetical protein
VVRPASVRLNRLGNSSIPRVVDIDLNNRKAILFSQLTKIMPLVVKSQLAQQIDCGILVPRSVTESRVAGMRRGGGWPESRNCECEQSRAEADARQNCWSCWDTNLRNSEIVGFFLIGSFSSHDGQDKSVYNWAGPNYGASNSLAN